MDDKLMNLCCQLASSITRTEVHPNPRVGAVISRNGSIISTGFHSKAGHDHAEIVALRKAGSDARGATLHVSLEPCCHHGKTPPCTDAIIDAGIAKVVIGELDPNPLVAGKGKDQLRAAGIDVINIPHHASVRRLNLAFRKSMLTGTPLVTYKYAMSLDGKTSSKQKQRFKLSSEQSHRYVHLLRSMSDAICVGSNTVTVDDPLLTVRSVNSDHQPIPVIFDTKAKISETSKLFTGHRRPILVTTDLCGARVKRLQQLADMIIVPKTDSGCSIQHALVELGRRNIQSLLLEGGGTLASAFFQQNAIDCIVSILTPHIIGNEAAPEAVTRLPQPQSDVTITGITMCGDDAIIHSYTGGDDGCSPDSWTTWDKSLASKDLLTSGS